MKDKWHWLRHKWGKWTQYEQKYGCFNARPTQFNPHYRTEIREWRKCQVCETVQDRRVAYDGTLDPSNEK